MRDAGNHTMRNLGRLLEQCKKCLIAVDCENSDAVKLAAALSSLPTEQLGKISKVICLTASIQRHNGNAG